MGIGLNVAAPKAFSLVKNNAAKLEQTAKAAKEGLIGVGENNKVKVFSHYTKEGDRVLTSYKEGSKTPYKTITIHPQSTYVSSSEKYRTGLVAKSHEIVIKENGKPETRITNMCDYHTFDGKPYVTEMRIKNNNGSDVTRRIEHANGDDTLVIRHYPSKNGIGNGAPVTKYVNGVEVSTKSNPGPKTNLWYY